MTLTIPPLLSTVFDKNLVHAMNYLYADYGFSNYEGILIRSIALLLGFCGICWTIRFSPNKRTFLTEIGQRSILIYLLHPLIIRGWRSFHLPVSDVTVLHLLFSFGVAVAACVLFGNKYIDKCYKFVMDWINKLLVKE